MLKLQIFPKYLILNEPMPEVQTRVIVVKKKKKKWGKQINSVTERSVFGKIVLELV